MLASSLTAKIVFELRGDYIRQDALYLRQAGRQKEDELAVLHVRKKRIEEQEEHSGRCWRSPVVDLIRDGLQLDIKVRS